MDTSIHLTVKQAPASTVEHTVMRDMPYCKAIGTLNWTALATHPNIMFTITTVTRFTTNPGPAHWKAIKCIFCYLEGTCDLWLSYGETKHALKGYADTDGSMAEDRHAIMGYTFLIDGGTVLWSSKWQEIVSLSTMESKYMAMTHSMKEVLWLHSLLSK